MCKDCPSRLTKQRNKRRICRVVCFVNNAGIGKTYRKTYPKMEHDNADVLELKSAVSVNDVFKTNSTSIAS